MDIINIMLVEDHPVFRQGLRRILESQKDMQVIIEVADGAQALRLAREMAPQVIVMDVNLPSMNGLQVTHSIKKELPNVAVVMLTAYHNDEQLFHAIRAGASAYYPKDVTPRKLVEAVRQVSQGNYVIDDTVLDKPQFAKWLTKEFERMGTGPGPVSAEDLAVDHHGANGLLGRPVGGFDIGLIQKRQDLIGVRRQMISELQVAVRREMPFEQSIQPFLQPAASHRQAMRTDRTSIPAITEGQRIRQELLDLSR